MATQPRPKEIDSLYIGVTIGLDVLETLIEIGNKAARDNLLTRPEQIILVMAYNAAMEAKHG